VPRVPKSQRSARLVRPGPRVRLVARVQRDQPERLELLAQPAQPAQPAPPARRVALGLREPRVQLVPKVHRALPETQERKVSAVFGAASNMPTPQPQPILTPVLETYEPITQRLPALHRYLLTTTITTQLHKRVGMTHGMIRAIPSKAIFTFKRPQEPHRLSLPLQALLRQVATTRLRLLMYRVPGHPMPPFCR
jgi:hypothetical protein